MVVHSRQDGVAVVGCSETTKHHHAFQEAFAVAPVPNLIAIYVVAAKFAQYFVSNRQAEPNKPNSYAKPDDTTCIHLFFLDFENPVWFG